MRMNHQRPRTGHWKSSATISIRPYISKSHVYVCCPCAPTIRQRLCLIIRYMASLASHPFLKQHPLSFAADQHHTGDVEVLGWVGGGEGGGRRDFSIEFRLVFEVESFF